MSGVRKTLTKTKKVSKKKKKKKKKKVRKSVECKVYQGRRTEEKQTGTRVANTGFFTFRVEL
jgi:hypothetical protein